MKVVLLLGSNRRNGNTARLAAVLAEELVSASTRRPESGEVECETIVLGREDVRFCRGCRVCFDRGERYCPNKDAVLPIKERLRAADVVVLASPVYVNDVSGVMKNWIDRMAHVCHRPEFAGKLAYVVATSGGSPARHAIRTMNVALLTWGFSLAGAVAFDTGARMSDDRVESELRPRLREVAGRIHGRLRPDRLPRPSFVSLMTFRIQQWSWRRVAQGTVDRDYWESHGWFDRHVAYYAPFASSPVKTFFARLVGAIVARAMG